MRLDVATRPACQAGDTPARLSRLRLERCPRLLRKRYAVPPSRSASSDPTGSPSRLRQVALPTASHPARPALPPAVGLALGGLRRRRSTAARVLHSFCGQLPALPRLTRAAARIQRVPEERAPYPPGMIYLWRRLTRGAAAARHLRSLPIPARRAIPSASGRSAWRNGERAVGFQPHDPKRKQVAHELAACFDRVLTNLRKWRLIGRQESLRFVPFMANLEVRRDVRRVEEDFKGSIAEQCRPRHMDKNPSARQTNFDGASSSR